jgi:hypothetical protein
VRLVSVARGMVFAAGSLAASLATGAPVTFGERTLDLPDPPGFVAVSQRLPQFMAIAQGYLPAGNRLVEAWLLPDDAAALERGEQVDIRRYFQLQTLRTLDGVPVSAAEFAEVSSQLEAGLGAAISGVGDQAAELTAQGNAAAKRQAGIDPGVGVGGLSYLGTFRREPWALFFTTRADVTAGDERVAATAASALAVIDHQLAYLYAYTYEGDTSAHGRQWAQDALSGWADAVRRSNPDDPALEASAARLSGGFDWSDVARGAAIGGLCGMFVWLFRRRRQR